MVKLFALALNITFWGAMAYGLWRLGRVAVHRLQSRINRDKLLDASNDIDTMFVDDEVETQHREAQEMTVQ